MNALRRRMPSERRRAATVIGCVVLSGAGAGISMAAPRPHVFPVAYAPAGTFALGAPHVGAATQPSGPIPEGALVEVRCETKGDPVSNGLQTSQIWARTNHGYLPRVYIDTGAAGWTPGIPRCESVREGPPRIRQGSPEYQALSADQIEAARTIIAIGKGHGFDERAQVIAIATALQESMLQNLDYGTADSLGVFQQRPSQGWGTRQQVMDLTLATRAFYGVANHNKNPGLGDVNGWQSISVNDAAQKVQRSAHPEAYGTWEALATEIVRDNQDVSPRR